jgi:Breast carcinoma amplified sequence 2 (BCAS2)
MRSHRDSPTAQALAGMEANMVSSHKRVREEADAINAQRQTAQLGASNQLYYLAQQRYELAEKNLQIELANEALRHELKRFKA